MFKRINPRMKVKALLSSLTVVSHMSIMVWYYSHSDEWQISNSADAGFFFFGISFILIAINMIISSSERFIPIQLEITKLHGVFMLSLGTIYALHYSGLLISNNNEKYFMIITAILIAVLIVIFSAWRHGYFKKDS